MFKSGFVSVVGRPNVGKSTLLNGIMGQKLTITSSKAQTTRNQIKLIHTEERGQVIFIDTPGLQKPRNKLDKFMLEESVSSLEGVDLVVMMVESGRGPGPGDRDLIERLKNVKDLPTVLLAINKADRVNKDDLLPLIADYSQEGIFKEIVPISARTGDNVDRLMDLIFENLEEGPMFYPEDMVTDQVERTLVADLIREKGLAFLQEEVPHGLAVQIEEMKKREDQDLYDIQATIYVERDSHKAIIIGKGGSMLKNIGTEARKDVEDLLGSRVNLQVWVKVAKNWRDKDERVKHFGYQAQS